MENNNNLPNVIFKIDEKLFSLPTNNVQAIITMPTVTKLPQAPATIRGMISYRDKIFKLVDLRKTLGLESLDEARNNFTSMMERREDDHKNWLAELENSVIENRPFKLTTDPHQCKFGKWYDNFKTDNYLLKDLLIRFDAPHKRIHAIGVEIEKLKAEGKFDEAKKIIAKTKHGDLAEMISLFDEVKKAYSRSLKELSIVVENGSYRYAVSVDSVVSVEYLEKANEDHSSQNYLSLVNSEILEELSQRTNGDFVVKLSESALSLN